MSEPFHIATMATPPVGKTDLATVTAGPGAIPPASSSALPAPPQTPSTPGSATSTTPVSVQSHLYQKVESPSPPPRCPSPVKASISVGQMGPPAPRPSRAGSGSMPPPPPRQPSQDAGARKRAREGSPPLPGQGSPIPRRSMSPPPRGAHGSPHGSPLSIRRSSSPPLPPAGSPLRRPRSSSPPYENIIIIPQRQSSPIKIPRRSASPPLPGQGQGASAFKRPRSASPSDPNFWHPGLPFPARPFATAPPRKTGDVESSASQRDSGSQRSGSSSSEDERGRRKPPRDDADATSGVQPGPRGGGSSSSDEDRGSRSSGPEMSDSSSSDRRRHEGGRGPSSEMSKVSSPAKRGATEAGPSRLGAMLPPPPRQPKRLSLPPAGAAEGAAGQAEGSLSGESRAAHNSSELALAAAATSSTGHTVEPAQDRLSAARPSRSAQDEAAAESRLAKQASDASSIIGGGPAMSDASSVGRARAPSPGPVSSGVTAVNTLAAGQSTGSAMQNVGDRASSSHTGKMHGFKEPPAVVRGAARSAAPGVHNRAAAGGPSAGGVGEGPAQSAESGAPSEAARQRGRVPNSSEALERVASNVLSEMRGSGGEQPPSAAPRVVRQQSSNRASLMGPPRGRPDMPPPSTSKPSGLPRAGGEFKVPQQRPPSGDKAPPLGAPRLQTEPAAVPMSGGASSASDKSSPEHAGQKAGAVMGGAPAGAEGDKAQEDPVQEIAAVLVGQETEDVSGPPHDQVQRSGASAASPSSAATGGLPAANPAPQTLEPALRALFPAAMYKEPGPPLPPKAASKGGSGQPPYEIPSWSAPPGQPYTLEVVKEGAVLSTLDVSRKGAYMFGRSERADFALEHATVSRYHAVLQFKEGGDAALFDLGSTHGTFVNKKQVKARVYVPVRVGDVLRFGQSSRLYVFQGPAALMPEEGLSRAEKQHLKRLEATQESKMAQESLVRARAATLSEVTWGQAEDAPEEDDQEDVEGITWETHTGPLTSNQEKSRDKVVKRREKIANLRKEMEAIQSKEIAQGGLTPGQQAQVARNEQRLEELSEELEAMEETLNESIRESLGVGTRVRTASGKRGRPGSDEEDGDSDEDEFYNRAGAQKRKKSAVGPSPAEAATVVETAETLLEKRDVLARERAVLEGEILQEEERRRAAPGSRQHEEDALDAFMSGVSTQIERDHVAQLRRELELLDAEAARVARLLRLADPAGEAAARWVPKAIPAGGIPRRTFVEAAQEKVAAAPEEAEAVFQKEEPKPRGLLQTPRVALRGGVVKAKGSSRGAKGPSMPGRDEKHASVESDSGQGERKAAAGDAGPSEKGDTAGAEAAGAGQRLGAQGGESRGVEDTSGQSEQGATSREQIGERVAVEGESRGTHGQEARPAAGAIGEAERKQGGGGAEAGRPGKERAGQGPELPAARRTRDGIAAEGDDQHTEQPVWEPPPDQSGDGRTALNDKLGY